MAVSDAPRAQADLDKCVHCGLCLNACPTYRELHVEMDSPRGRIYQMVAGGRAARPSRESYQEHIDLCLACRGCETACPSGVEYGRLVEAARADIETAYAASAGHARCCATWCSSTCCPAARAAPGRRRGDATSIRRSGLQKLRAALARASSRLDRSRRAWRRRSSYRNMGRVFPAQGERKISRRVSLRLHREHLLRAPERSHRARAASQRLRGDDSRRPNLLRSSARSRRTARCRAPPGAAEYRRAGRTAASTRSSPTPAAADRRSRNTTSCWSTTRIRERAQPLRRADEGCERVSGVHRAESAHGRSPRHGDLSGFLPSGARPEDPLRSAPIAATRSRPDAQGNAPVGSRAAAAPESTTSSTPICRWRCSKRKWQRSTPPARSASSPRIPAACCSFARESNVGAAASACPTWSRFWTKPIRWLTALREKKEHPPLPSVAARRALNSTVADSEPRLEEAVNFHFPQPATPRQSSQL